MLRILHLEDREEDACLISAAFSENGVDARFTLVKNRDQFFSALEKSEFDMVLTDCGLPGFDAAEAVKIVRRKLPEAPVIAVSGTLNEDRANAVLKAGAADCVHKDLPLQLIAVIRREEEILRLRRLNLGMARLVEAVQELSLARDLNAIMAVVKRAARELTGADGATFVLREGGLCHYADEDAISPLWKGQKFPLSACISGWTMLHRQAAAIEDIYADPRIPADAYRPTFVKSLAMVPIRAEDPIGAIGNYWARQRMPTDEEVRLLQALANTTAVAMENVRIYNELDSRVKARTAELEFANRELESFSYAVSHDLSAPLRSIRGFSELVLKNCAERLDETGKRHLEVINASSREMAALIEDLLRLAKYSKAPLKLEEVNLSELAGNILSRLSDATPERRGEFNIADGLKVQGDAGLLRAAMENLLSNAWKYTSKCAQARIELDSTIQDDGSTAYIVRDNGVGFDMKHAQQIFEPFQRLHNQTEFPGTGVGLATVQRIIQKHGGRIWAEAEADRGAAFYFTVPDPV